MQDLVNQLKAVNVEELHAEVEHSVERDHAKDKFILSVLERCGLPNGLLDQPWYTLIQTLQNALATQRMEGSDAVHRVVALLECGYKRYCDVLQIHDAKWFQKMEKEQHPRARVILFQSLSVAGAFASPRWRAISHMVGPDGDLDPVREAVTRFSIYRKARESKMMDDQGVSHIMEAHTSTRVLEMLKRSRQIGIEAFDGISRAETEYESVEQRRMIASELHALPTKLFTALSSLGKEWSWRFSVLRYVQALESRVLSKVVAFFKSLDACAQEINKDVRQLFVASGSDGELKVPEAESQQQRGEILKYLDDLVMTYDHELEQLELKQSQGAPQADLYVESETLVSELLKQTEVNLQRQCEVAFRASLKKLGLQLVDVMTTEFREKFIVWWLEKLDAVMGVSLRNCSDSIDAFNGIQRPEENANGKRVFSAAEASSDARIATSLVRLHEILRGIHATVLDEKTGNGVYMRNIRRLIRTKVQDTDMERLRKDARELVDLHVQSILSGYEAKYEEEDIRKAKTVFSDFVSVFEELAVLWNSDPSRDVSLGNALRVIVRLSETSGEASTMETESIIRLLLTELCAEPLKSIKRIRDSLKSNPETCLLVLREVHESRTSAVKTAEGKWRAVLLQAENAAYALYVVRRLQENPVNYKMIISSLKGELDRAFADGDALPREFQSQRRSVYTEIREQALARVRSDIEAYAKPIVGEFNATLYGLCDVVKNALVSEIQHWKTSCGMVYVQNAAKELEAHPRVQPLLKRNLPGISDKKLAVRIGDFVRKIRADLMRTDGIAIPSNMGLSMHDVRYILNELRHLGGQTIDGRLEITRVWLELNYVYILHMVRSALYSAGGDCSKR